MSRHCSRPWRGKTAVDRVGRGKERQVKMRLPAMTHHCVYEPEFCNPAAGWGEPLVRANPARARARSRRTFGILGTRSCKGSHPAALNAWLEQRCLALWRQTPHGKRPGAIADLWAEEQAALMPPGSVERSKRVSPTCLISFERNCDRVPASFASLPVSLRICPDRLVVAAEGNILCEHARLIQRSRRLPPKTIYDWRHYLAVVQRKPGALRNDAPFPELTTAFRQLQDPTLRQPGGDRAMVDILALVLQHDAQVVRTAGELSLAEGLPTKTHVLNMAGTGWSPAR